MKQNDRVRSKVTGNPGTVTQAGQREGFVHVLFDGATDAICFDTGSLEPDWESRVAALTAERDAAQNEARENRCLADHHLSDMEEREPAYRARIAALEKQLREARAAFSHIMESAVLDVPYARRIASLALGQITEAD